MGATADEAQTSIAYVSLWTCAVDIALDATFAAMTGFAARTIVLMVAAGGTETDFVALARAVAGNHGLGATD